MPQCQAEFLVLLFYEVGLCGQGDEGIVPLSWQEIKAFNEVTDSRMTPWEVKTLHDMSLAYVLEVRAGVDVSRQSPTQLLGATSSVNREAVASAWKAMKQAANEKFK